MYYVFKENNGKQIDLESRIAERIQQKKELKRRRIQGMIRAVGERKTGILMQQKAIQIIKQEVKATLTVRGLMRMGKQRLVQKIIDESKEYLRTDNKEHALNILIAAEVLKSKL